MTRTTPRNAEPVAVPASIPTSFNLNGVRRAMSSIEDLCRELNGCRFTSVSWDGEVWFFSVKEELAVMTQHQWRLVGDGRILISSQDRDEDETPETFSQRVTSELAHNLIESSTCDLPTGDLTLLFENGKRLQFLNCSVGSCDWVGVLNHVIIVRCVAP